MKNRYRQWAIGEDDLEASIRSNTSEKEVETKRVNIYLHQTQVIT